MTNVMRFTLVEMLVYTSVFVAMTSSFMAFFHSVVRLNRHAVSQATRYQSMARLRQQWRIRVAACGKYEWKSTVSGLECGTTRITSEGSRVHFTEAGGREAVLILPKGAIPSFSIKSDDNRTRIILTITFPPNREFREESIRLVCVIPKNGGK
jgi:hypothetical protein